MSQLIGGEQANATGGRLERVVRGLLDGEGYHKIQAKSLEEIVRYGQPAYTPQFRIGKGIYGTDIKVDFVVYHPDKHPEPFIIECKWQQVAGSVDEKFPYLVENIMLHPIDTVLLLDGGGYKAGAESWIRNQVDQKRRLRKVLSLQEFQRWVNDGNI